jgi:hypothetical protein
VVKGQGVGAATRELCTFILPGQELWEGGQRAELVLDGSFGGADEQAQG